MPLTCICKRLRGILLSCTIALAFVAASPGAEALPGDQNELPEVCQGVAGAAYTAYEIAAFAAPPPFDFPPTVGAYAGNWALRLCPPQIVAPPDIVGIDGYEPDAVTASSSDPELPNPFEDDPNCYASINQSITKTEYENFFGASTFQGDWGDLGTPQVFHFNTGADVRIFGGKPMDDPGTEGDESLRDERQPTRNDQGQSILKLPVGRNSISYRADTLVSPLDVPFIYIPGIPAASKPFRELVENSGTLTAVAIKTADLGIDVIKSPVGVFAIDKVINIGFRHSQLGVIDDIVNTDSQNVWVFDRIPPVLTTRTDVSALPANVRALLSYDVALDLFYLEAIQPGGIRSNTGVDFLGRLLDFHDHCNREVTLRNDAGGLGFWPTGDTIDLVWTASDPGPRDASGVSNSVQLTHRIEIRDSFPPVLLAPPSQVHELPPGQANQTITVNLGVPRVFDLADLTPELSNDAPGNDFGLGLSEVTWTASDGFNTSEDVQLINIKEAGSNTPPVADTQSVQTQSFEETEIVLTGSDADFHPSVNRFDPLTFSIVDPPDEGIFVAPLLPFFIDDFRLEASASRFEEIPMQNDPQAYCRTRTGNDPDRFQIAYPYLPEWMAVDDDGNTMVHDEGSAICLPGGGFSTLERFVIFDANQEITASTAISAGGSPSDIFWDDNTNRIYVSRIDNQDDDWVYVYGPDLTQLARYNLGTGFSAPWMLDRPSAVTVDSRGIMYVANNSRVNAYFQVDGVHTVEGDTVFLGAAWDDPDFGRTEIQSLATDSEDNLYIGYPDRIVKLSPAGLVQSVVFTPGRIVGWLGYCSSNLTTEYACDTPNRRSLGFACTDDLCGRDAIYGGEPGQFREAQGIAIDPNDVLYVSDFGNARVQRFTPDGFFGGEAKSQGAGFGFLLGDFGNPKDIEVNSDHFYILNRDARLLHIFETSPLTPIDDGSASVLYRSNNNFVGTDRFRFGVTDGFDSAEADVTIDVTRNFRAPEVPDSGLAFQAPPSLEDQTVTFTVPGTDPDGGFDTLTVVLVRPPEHGEVTFDGLDATYTPDTDYFGADDFTYRVSDGLESSAELGEVSLDVSAVEDEPRIDALSERTVNLGFRLAHRTDVFDPDEDETLMVQIDWGDGTISNEGHFELDGEPIPASDAMNPDGTIREDVETTGPILGIDPLGRGILMADHVYTTAGTYQINTCVYDKVEHNPVSQQKSLTGLSKQACAVTNATVGSAAELAIDVEGPGVERAAGADVDFMVRLRNLAFDLDSNDPRFPQLPSRGSDIVSLVLTGEVSAGLELLGLDTVDGVCTVSGNEFDCTFANVPYDAERTLTVSARVAPTAPGRALLGVSLEGNWLDMREAPFGGGTVEIVSSGAAPTLTSISPASGAPEGYTEVTLTGTNFEAGAMVLFDGRPGTQLAVIDSTTLTVFSPAAPGGVVDVTVANPDDQQSTLNDAWTYEVAQPPGGGGGGGGSGGGGSGGGGGGSGGGGGGSIGWWLLSGMLLIVARRRRRP